MNIEKNTSLNNAELNCPTRSRQLDSESHNGHYILEDLPEPPLVKGRPIIGSAYEIFSDPLTFFQKKHEEFGNIFQVKSLRKRYLVLSGPEANRLISGEKKHLFTTEKTWGKGILNKLNAIIAVDGEVHREQRDFLKEFLSVAAYKHRMPELIQPLETCFANLNNDEYLVGPLTRKLVSHQMGKVILRDTVPEPSSKVIESIIYLQNSILNVFLISKPAISLFTPRFLISLLRVSFFSQKYFKAVYDSAAQSRETPYVRKMLEGPDKPTDWYTRTMGYAFTMVPFFAGLDTLGATTAFIFYELLKNPTLKDKLTQQADEIYSQGELSFEHLEQMEDIFGFVFETMRFHPIAFGINRTATEDFQFNGYKIKRDDQVVVFTAANHFNKQYFPDPLTFDIERYRAPRKEHRKDGVFSPFGRGPHTCLAAGLSELILAVNLVVFLRHFEISTVTPLEEVYTVCNPSPALSNNFKVRLKKRK